MSNSTLLSSLVGAALLAFTVLASAQDVPQAFKISQIDAPASSPEGVAGTFACPNGGELLILQPPNQSLGLSSDSDCGGCSNGQQSVAEDFVLTSPTSVAQLVFWGIYYPDNQIPVPPDPFTVIFHEDATGLPGAEIVAQDPVAPTSATLTGVTPAVGVSEILYVVDITPVALPAGTFWVEVFTNSADNTDTFGWETGNLDAVNGRAGLAFAFETPGGDWLNFDPDLSLALCGTIPEIPVTINKAYADGEVYFPEVEITLTCPTAIVNGDTNTGVLTTVDGAATFVVTGFPEDGEDCTATETVPAGYVQSSATGCDALNVLPGAEDVGCTITNRPTEATFTVDKNYSDGNPALAAAVTPACTDAGGGPGITYAPASGNALHGTNFTTTVKYFAGATNCTASEVDLVGYTEDLAQSTCDTGVAISDVADGTCIIFNQQDPVTILASKEFTQGGGTATFDASCEAGTVTTITAAASVGSPAEFEISNFPYDGTSCAVTEPVPPSGYYEETSTCNDLEIVPSDDDTLCTITNAPTRATFQVTKEFTDGDNPTEVEVTIDCFTGLPITQSQTIDETQDVTFVITDFDSGELDCEITEEALNGYTPTYDPDGPSSNDAIDGCNFYDVEGGAENFCHIVNDADFVDVEIEKVWVIEGSGGHQIDTEYRLTLYCDAPIEDADQYCYGGGNNPQDSPEGIGDTYYCKKFYGDASQVFVAHVQPEYPTSYCWVDERVYDDTVEISNGCGNIVISAGTGDSCLITNTVFFEGIPTLSQYGMAILALLMLGVGLVGFRRFA